MTDDISGAARSGKGDSPFPSRRDVHGSRIPVRQGSEGAGGPATGQFPTRKELRDTGMLPQVKKQAKKPVPAPAAKQPSASALGQPQPAQVAQQKRVSSTKPDLPRRSQKKSDAPKGMAVPPKAAAKPQAASPGGNGRQANGAPPASQLFPEGGVRRPTQVRTKKAPKWRVAVILLVLLGLIGGAVYFAFTSLGSGSNPLTAESLDYPGPGEGSVEVTISSGELGSDIGQSLVDAGVVKTLKGFTKAFDANSAASTIKPGTYTLRLGMTSAGALAALLDDANRRDNAITVNAGQTVAQVTEKMVSVGGFSEQEVEEALANPQALGLPAVAGNDIEGWLAPGSYEVGKETTPTDVLAQMIQGTVSTLDGLGVPEDEREIVLTKASILEREAGSREDMPKVARVIQNRLDFPDGETRGLLQMDSTVLYGEGKSGGLPTEEELASDSPYNTYRVVGLPPGPIASPSVDAIEATLDPAEGDWLYFVTVNLDSGETLFTSSLDEQEANIGLLREWCAANKDRC